VAARGEVDDVRPAAVDGEAVADFQAAPQTFARTCEFDGFGGGLIRSTTAVSSTMPVNILCAWNRIEGFLRLKLLPWGIQPSIPSFPSRSEIKRADAKYVFGLH